MFQLAHYISKITLALGNVANGLFQSCAKSVLIHRPKSTVTEADIQKLFIFYPLDSIQQIKALHFSGQVDHAYV